MAENIITNSLRVGTQLPLDGKLYTLTLASLQTLGTNDAKAFEYYEDMVVHVVENHSNYIWREEATAGETGGLLGTSYTYPAGFSAGGIDYGGRVFNFFIVEAGGGSQNLQETLDNGFMANNRSIILQGSPASYNVSGTAGLASLSANRLRMLGTTDRVMDVSNETIINRASTDPTDGSTTIQFELPNLGDTNTGNTITVPADTGIMALTKNIPVVTAGTGIDVDMTNPLAPVISVRGGGTAPALANVLNAGNTADNAINLSGGNASMSIQSGTDNAIISPANFDARAAGQRTTFMATGMRLRNANNSNYIDISALSAPDAQYVLRAPLKNGTLATIDDITSETPLQHVRTPITNSQVINFTAPIALTPVPTGGRVILLHTILLIYNHSTTSFNSGNIFVQAGTGLNAGITTPIDLTGLTSSANRMLKITPADTDIPVDTALTLNITNPPSSGGGDFIVLVDYSVRVINPN